MNVTSMDMSRPVPLFTTPLSRPSQGLSQPNAMQRVQPAGLYPELEHATPHTPTERSSFVVRPSHYNFMDFLTC